ncbi:tRNA (N6-threonylcarbamoyladenosine(37)-N6)-methyltransferase TrmO [Acinetobacter shaoyimingii]|uniref:tRNA (N6-threonylcarbamoyladenosine(37)-N6)-methyltransferase TrmO n=1 Tax=Acinetobacter shaoyimingii TaxID=2715164 RepID=A0A6G8RUS2_9GAMM|nr:tRNA (N6-threonylcarbamoyladenosine(37)-N6)-methyltransferase TrmO [Acinetobacter shaoyimingii]QIO05463.1 tRNA (N6-threonylcarbamoyladenosine(37)-N6)-methyltransferase TrmO [Acinetobacter shaoyimingii]
MNELKLPIIGYMHSPYREKFGIPRQPNLVDVESYIELSTPYNDILAFEGIDEFSHLWLIWQFHDNKNQQDVQKFRPQVRPPRLGGNQKIGVFATRSMYRPAPIGLSVVKFKAIKKVGASVRLYISGSDLLDGTPILDIKPYIHYSDAVLDAKSAYAQAEPTRKLVSWNSDAMRDQHELLKKQIISEQQIAELEQVLSLDPRPAYQDDCERIYGMHFANVNVKFKVSTQVEIVALIAV